MVVRYVLISTKNSYEHTIADRLKRIEDIVDVEPLAVEGTMLVDPFFEDYDLIVKLQAQRSSEIQDIINNKIRGINGVDKIKVVSRPG
jgi:hypothetical protein